MCFSLDNDLKSQIEQRTFLSLHVFFPSCLTDLEFDRLSVEKVVNMSYELSLPESGFAVLLTALLLSCCSCLTVLFLFQRSLIIIAPHSQYPIYAPIDIMKLHYPWEYTRAGNMFGLTLDSAVGSVWGQSGCCSYADKTAAIGTEMIAIHALGSFVQGLQTEEKKQHRNRCRHHQSFLRLSGWDLLKQWKSVKGSRWNSGFLSTVPVTLFLG